MIVTATGAAGSPSFPDRSDPVLCGRLLRGAHVTGRCPVWIYPSDLEHTLTPVTGPTVFDAVDGREVLARWWPGPCRPECPCGDQLPAVIPQIRGSEVDLALRPETFAERRLVLAGPLRRDDPRCPLPVVLVGLT